MRLIHCSEERHAEAILDIFNHAILNSTALYDYKPREPSSMVEWFAGKRRGNLPVIGYEDEQGRLLGFASYGPFRDRPANKYSVEHSVYVHHECRGMGLGKRLLGDLIELAIERDVHVMVGGIDLANQASIALHERLGFEPAGVIREAAYKFGRWLDLAFYQKILETPLQPVEG
ncbi:N-acetyltransferase family protein [Pseudomonas plecoglossicida]|uniref:N-acetyltransferase n=1 Tax=Pseudomonas plecoglossicida TaxID=70775 RepID=A0AAD0QVL3_PSEDL|nr:GNAT family N-acetyltransferase [Pseudomonas plecoglossicida]AXM95044.1 N-acetyltransferase [Pseudomonas plecoglossicida]EPB94198.1 sortase [Pseudomonas plecoglossicida NB2011]GLR37153.1 phosphinothricin acetyltransferase [Pseudomonas plecoglossicida]